MIATVVYWLIETACIVFLLGLAFFVAFQHAGAAVENALAHCPIPADVDLDQCRDTVTRTENDRDLCALIDATWEPDVIRAGIDFTLWDLECRDGAA